MSNKDEPAFPFTCQGPTTAPEFYYGISKRDYFAAAALTGFLKDGIVSTSIPSLAKAIDRDAEWRKTMIEAVVKSSFDVADAMLAESEKEKA